VGEAGNRKYLFDGVETPNLTLKEGATYTFDQSDPSNDGHPLRFSDVVDGTHGGGDDWGSYQIVGTPGTGGSASIISINNNWPTLYYYCEVHSGMGGTGVLTTTDREFSYYTADELLAASFGGVVETTITGGADADLFYIFKADGNSDQDLILFKTRPEFSNPTDANADGVYELELTKTDSTGFSVSQVVNIEVRQADESEQKPIEAPGTSLVLEITEQTDSLTDDNGSNRNIVGTDEADVFSKQDLDNGSKQVSGGLGDDVFSAGDDFLTGGEGSDTFLISLDRIVDLNQLGIVDNSQPYEEGRKEGIYGYDQNRDGTLDLATELDHAWLNVIYDFTPGTDKLALSTYGWTGTNVPSLRSEDVSYIQGTGDLSAHTLVVINNSQTIDRGYTDGGVAAVLLNTEASSISKEVDEITVGAKYENILGNIGSAIGATTTTITGPNGEDVEVLQLPDGQYVFVYAQYSSADNQILFENLALSTSGELYVPRGEGPDFEAPGDGNKDNIYEFLFSGQTFSDLKLKQESWGGYNVDWENSVRTSDIAFTVFLEVKDDIADNVGKISIAEADFFSTTDANGDAVLDTQLVDLVFSQISAVQGSLQDIDMKAIAEEINFDFSFFATADTRTQAEDWFGDYQERSFDDFGRELESTFERNLLSKYSTYTNADSLSNLTGTADNDTLTGGDAKETIFGKKGDDTITGGAGDDVIFGDQGADTLDGGAGSDSIDGGSGDDTIIIGEGQDVLDGGSGNDVFDFTNITDLPEFIKGGSGVDTLVLAGLSSSGLEYDDVNSDGQPDYTGIDLNKLVSIKETWTYQDESGNEVSEEGWRNRVESIESIDLRDSESQINKDYNQNQVDTIGFRLASNKVTLTDSDGAVHSLYTASNGTVLQCQSYWRFNESN
jgi:Ca2+-binding RTX toxin-like protein